jgi:excinuclease ABC subunit B
MGKLFHFNTNFPPLGDQKKAIPQLSRGLLEGKKSQVLLGITGSGKTYTMAGVIAEVQRPALVLAHNKTLAAQLYQEFKNFFPNNAVEYFVSYYDYYQPEAYIARTDTYIEKDLAINDQIDRMRLSATRSLMERNDVIIVSSVSCIYGLGLPEYYQQLQLHLHLGDQKKRDDLCLHLVEMHYKRNDLALARGHFRARGDVMEVMPAYEEELAYRIEFFGNEIEGISSIDPLTGKLLARLDKITIFPGSHHAVPEDVRHGALETIHRELEERSLFYAQHNQFLERERLRQRTLHDLEMLREMGSCKGIENYSRHFSKRSSGDPPPCLLDYFPNDFVTFIDESHQTLPQLHAMYNGDRARKEALVAFGFRLPSAFDNRPLKFEETMARLGQVIYVSATPGVWELQESKGAVVEQIIRPTGLLDPIITLKPAQNQVDDVLEEIRQESEQGNRVLVTTLTKKLAEQLAGYLNEIGVKAKYLHSDIDTVERIRIINELRLGYYDVLVGINLLREGLDLPEVGLVAILDADKEGFLRSETALIQTCGRAARNIKGRVIMYADRSTGAITNTIQVTQNRRKIQQKYNENHGITPKSAKRSAAVELETTFGGSKKNEQVGPLTVEKIEKEIEICRSEMQRAAQELRFPDAARFRDEMHRYEKLLLLEEGL